MCFGGDDAPPPPDPAAVAAAQQKLNIATAQANAKANKEIAAEQARLAMTGQTSDLGSLQYIKDPNSPSGYRAVTTLAPESQALLAQQRDIQANLGDVSNTSLNNVSRAISGGPFDLTAARGREISDIQQTFLDPEWNQQKDALENQLINQGVRRGSKQYENAMRQYSQQRDDAYNKMFLDAFTTANNAALTERNLPLQDYATLIGTMRPVSSLPTPNTPTPGIQGVNIQSPDLMGATYQSYNAAAQQAANQNSGLWNLAGTLGQAAIMASDRRVKEDIRLVGSAENGLNLYEFRYVGKSGTHRGFMADEVRQRNPDAVVSINGVDHVDYLMAVM